MRQAGRLVGLLAAALCARVFLASPLSAAPNATAGTAAPAATAADGSPSTSSQAPSVGSGDFLALQQRYVELDQKTRPAVVQVNSTVTDGGKDTTYVSTGFFISRDGYILTTDANHLQEATRVYVSHEGFPYIAEVKGLDPVTNLALLRVVQLPKSFSVISLEEGSLPLPPRGTLLLGVAYKLLDLDPTLVAGLVEGYTVDYGNTKFRTLHLRTSIEDYGGEDGSPLLDLDGHLAGIIIAALPDAHASLVLPARAVLRVRDDLLKYGHALYGSFGFESHEIINTATGTRGVLVSSIEYGGPALAAGLRANDQLLALGDAPIHTDADLRQATFFAHPGQDMTVRVNRDGEEIELHLRVGEMEQAAMPAPSSTAGIPAPVVDPPAGQPLTGPPAQTVDPRVPPSEIIEKK